MFYALVVEEYTAGNKFILGILFAVLLCILLNYAFKMIEMGYVLKYRKPLYNHFYISFKRLKKSQKDILQNNFLFYKKLSNKEKKNFEHRVAAFIKDKDFIGREDVVITDEMKVLISATAVMLTFGFRDFFIGIISKVIVYPNKFYSKTNDAYHKGEFNPKLKTLVLSWEDFLEGFRIPNDNINLGIHEFSHAIHLNSMKERDVSAIIFDDSFKELSKMLFTDESLRNKLANSDYFRNYAYTNQFEFLAVIIENFIETPKAFKVQFPKIYAKVKQMLNFNFLDY